MTEQEYALFGVGGEIRFQPLALFLLGGKAGVDNLGVDYDEMLIAIIEGLVVGTEILVPEPQVVLLNSGRGGPIVWLVANVVISRR